MFCLFFCCKQKTAYEMRISDWSSDVCSSDLTASRRNAGARALAFSFIGARARTYMSFSFKCEGISEVADGVIALRVEPGDARDGFDAARKSAPADEDDHVDRLGDPPPRTRDPASLDQLFAPVKPHAPPVRVAVYRTR